MRKILGTLAIAVLALTACSGPVDEVLPTIEPAALVAAPAHTEMLNELRPLLTSIESSDAALVSEAFEACANLLFRDKDKYRDAVMAQYADIELALDHLSVAAAAKKYLCP